MTYQLLEEMQLIFRTEHPVLIYPSSATGAWEAAITNALSPGDSVLVFNQGFFTEKWAQVAERFGLHVQFKPWESRRGLTADAVMEVLHSDVARSVKAILVVHNETSTGVTSDVEAIGNELRESGHPALLLVDAVSSLGTTDFQHDEWGVDVTVTGSQKGLMLPPGLSFVALSPRALAASESARLPHSYWSWRDHLEFNKRGFFPYTPATNLFFGLNEALSMLREEGLPTVLERHARLAGATRAAVSAWGLEGYALEPSESSNALTAVMMPNGLDADEVRRIVLEQSNMSLGTGLGKLRGRIFRIGHLGDLNTLSLIGTIAGVEMGLASARVPVSLEGVSAAMAFLMNESEAE
jgi:alanine-glyoxylate transaminase/serine-glyoxylate transaminase/serine-pyruvate transaminase